MRVLLFLLAGVCAAGASGCKPAQAPVQAQQPAAAPGAQPVIRQILLMNESAAPGGAQAQRPNPVTPDVPIAVSVGLTAPVEQDVSLSLRLIDLRDGRDVGRQTQAIKVGQDAARFEFKPEPAWTPGRHLIEARLEPKGKVFQRDFDVVPAPPAKPSGA
ncbi:hypothetical protein [Pseudoxanthomonas winnipegensis]|uniref:Lipoprotein n=1 Tax=Pseudoxanthomonas winnipegensis TaxID=2480810 RepID=A0A4Q8M8X5_9GAMM|nr:hypothetical protein [Pseudoxanthomonas winnipegensis]TAA46601.1 hypothetical protein EA655_02710 [Pseudoxanthomonas winnipegensis]